MIGVDGKVIQLTGTGMKLLQETLSLCFSVRKSIFQNNPVMLAAFDAGLQMILDGKYEDMIQNFEVFENENDMTEYLKNRKNNKDD